MPKTTTYHKASGLLLLVLTFTVLVFAPRPAFSQETGNYSDEEITQMLAPIALYPDALLSQVLIAATYPIEVIEADRWLRRSPDLQGDALDEQLLDKDWDPSVKALCHFPSVLSRMSQNISETTALGDAFLAQEAEVLDKVQALRHKAYDRGNLTTSSEQRIVVEKETIIIEPSSPRVIYVPYYDPYFVYGPWWYPAYPPYYWGPSLRVGLGFGISFRPGVHFSFSFGNWCYFDWPSRYIYFSVTHRPSYVRHDHWTPRTSPWRHLPHHRRGVAYHDRATATKYGHPSHHGDTARTSVRERSGGTAGATRDERSQQRQRRIERELHKHSYPERNLTGRQGLSPQRPQLERRDTYRQQQPQVERSQRQRVERQLVTPQQRRVERELHKHSFPERSRTKQQALETRKHRERTDTARQEQAKSKASKRREVDGQFDKAQQRQTVRPGQGKERQTTRDKNGYLRDEQDRREWPASGQGRGGRPGW